MMLKAPDISSLAFEATTCRLLVVLKLSHTDGMLAQTMKLRIRIITSLFMLAVTAAGSAQDELSNADGAPESKLVDPQGAATAPVVPIELSTEIKTTIGDPRQSDTVATLRSLTELRKTLQEEKATLQRMLEEDRSALEKQNLLNQIEKLDEDIRATNKNIQEIAAGADIASLRATEAPAFDFQRELFSLLEPAIKEMKDMTSHVRQKNEYKDRIEYYSDKLPTAERAIENLAGLVEQAEDGELKATLESLQAAWEKQRTFLTSEIQSASIQLEKLEMAELSLSETSQSYFKSFFQQRGLYIGRAILVVAVILLLSSLLHRLMERYIAGYQKPRRSFQIRLLDLSHRIFTGLLIIVGPMIVFYLAEDWLLFSLGVLLLLGAAITLRHAIPRYWQLAQLFLNVGPVREGERIELNGLPWLVQKINFYTLLKNPTAGLVRRIKIDDLLEIRSRETKKNEAWFPCKPGDWITIDDDRLAKVIGISEELTEIILRGGARKTYTTSAFLDEAPVCLSKNFRVKETIGVSYALQKESVTTICQALREHIEQRIEDEGYADHLLNLSVEFELANASSLDIVVIADYAGEIASSYRRLQRSTQRWCVEACTNHGWEIPYMQVTVHQPA